MQFTLRIILIITIISSCKTVKYSNEDDVYIGKPKIITTEVYRVIDQKEEFAYKTIDEFDSKGRVVLHKTLGKYRSALKYIYDKKGNMTKLVLFGNNDEICGENHNLYNDKGLIVIKESWRFNPKDIDRSEWIYNDDGRLIEVNGVNNGKFLFKSIFKYQGKDTTILLSLDSLGNQTSKTTTIIALDRTKLSIRVNSKNDTTEIRKTYYDKFGRPERIESSYPNSSKIISKTFSYERILDKKNNWIYEKYISNGKSEYSHKRTIKY